MSTKNRIDHLTDDAQRLDNQITQRCAELGITLTELAHRMGVTPQTLHNIRRGAVQPRLQTQVALEDALGWERGGYDTARAGGTPRLKDTTPNAPIPPASASAAPTAPTALLTTGTPCTSAERTTRCTSLTSTTAAPKKSRPK